MEIQRLIGRSLRVVTDLEALDERTVWLDCDVIRADGGTRTAAITGSLVALGLAFQRLEQLKALKRFPLKDYVAAISVGIVGSEMLLDLDYVEDSNAEMDMNVVMTGSGRLVEVQATAEGRPYTVEELNRLLDLARPAIQKLVALQQSLLRIDLPASRPGGPCTAGSGAGSSWACSTPCCARWRVAAGARPGGGRGRPWPSSTRRR